MSVKSLSQLFLVGFLGFALVGCSSAPKTEEVDNSKEVATAQVDADIEAAKRAAAEKAAADLAELKAMIAGKAVHFEFDRSEIRPDDYKLIKANADYMAIETSATVTIEGHCDERGTREYNLALGERRANAVKNALIAEGVSPSRINVVSFGEDKPVAEAHNEAAWSKNRRAEFMY